jgi:catechol 2,3-dioxygenase-like lactoylglutathione lyase family enzyme
MTPAGRGQGSREKNARIFDHVGIRVSDRAAGERFYRLVLGALGVEPTHSGPDFVEWGDFALGEGDAVTTGLHVGFAAPSREHVDAFWRAGVEAGFRNDGEPGPRPQYGEDYYGGFLLDPDGSSAEAVHHGGLARGVVVDHVWLRVADVAASRDFYALVGRHAGFDLTSEPPDPPRARFSGGNGSFSVVKDGKPARNVHLAFGARDNAPVDAFHAELVGAGYADNGSPGERPQYHTGYYAAFVLDPDGNNVEVVNHNR